MYTSVVEYTGSVPVSERHESSNSLVRRSKGNQLSKLRVEIGV